MSSERILVTGAAGFIGFHLSRRLLLDGKQVVGLDSLNDYYDVRLKESRLRILQRFPGFEFTRAGLEDKKAIDVLFEERQFTHVVNLAAQAGVRYSLTNPYAYLDSNLTGFLNILEACRNFMPKHLIYASSSSVYGANQKTPFSVHDNVDHPLALYAATKKANELMAHAYANLYAIPVTGLRFFTVYGPFGRPDMALFIFTKAILEGKPIDVYNFGKMKRDFTYIDDIVESMVRLLPLAPSGREDWDAMQPDPSYSFAPYRLLNIGNNSPAELLDFIGIIERKLGRKAILNLLPMQDGDVKETSADVEDLAKLTGFRPGTSLEDGIGRFISWYREYYNVS
jgi:UDP-glucuronate 4-epimerase